MEIKKDGNHFVDSETRTFCDVENVAKNQLRKKVNIWLSHNNRFYCYSDQSYVIKEKIFFIF